MQGANWQFDHHPQAAQSQDSQSHQPEFEQEETTRPMQVGESEDSRFAAGWDQTPEMSYCPASDPVSWQQSMGEIDSCQSLRNVWSKEDCSDFVQTQLAHFKPLASKTSAQKVDFIASVLAGIENGLSSTGGC